MAHPPAYDPYYMPPPVPDGYLSNTTTSGGRDSQPGIRTLFMSGLPDDVKAREIHNLFRRRHGFDSCQLKYTGRGNQVVAFATFVNHQSAMAALHAVNGIKFDPHSGSTLHVELARENSRRKIRLGSGPYVVIDNRSHAVKDNRQKKIPDAQETSSDDGGESDNSSGPKNPESDDVDSSDKIAAAVAATDNAVASGKEQSENASDECQPCSTLFIANLGPKCTEDELKQALSQYPGFNSLKIRARGGMPVSFADFEEVEHATAAMTALQGSELPSSDRGGMSIEYARSKMRKP